MVSPSFPLSLSYPSLEMQQIPESATTGFKELSVCARQSFYWLGWKQGTAAHYKRWSRSRRGELLTGPGQKGLPELRCSRSAWGSTKQQLAACTLPSEPARAPAPEPSNSRPWSTHASPRTPCLTCACHAPSCRRDERGEWCHSAHPATSRAPGQGCGGEKAAAPGPREARDTLWMDATAPPGKPPSPGSLKLLGGGAFSLTIA